MNAQVLGAPPAQQGDLPVEPPGLNEPVEQEEPLLPQVQVAALPHDYEALWRYARVSASAPVLAAAAMCWLQLFIHRAAGFPPSYLLSFATLGVTLVACLWACRCHSRQSAPAFALLLLALLQLASAGVTVERQWMLHRLAYGATPTLSHAIAYLTPPLVTGSVYVYAHNHAGGDFGWLLLAVLQLATGTSAAQYVSGLFLNTSPWHPFAFFLLGLPIGFVLWPYLEVAVQLFARVLPSDHSLAYINGLLDAGCWADACANLSAQTQEELVFLGVCAIAGMALSDVVLMRVVHGAPELPVPGQLVSPSG